MSRVRGTGSWRRFVSLYLRSRFVLPVALGILLGLGLVSLWAWHSAPDLRNAVERETVQRNLITSLAVIAAAAVVLTVRSPWAEMDDAAGSTVRRVRMAVFLSLTATLVVAMIALGALWEAPGARWMLARAFGGWLGVTLVARQVLGDGRGWLLSFAWAGLSLVSGDTWRVHYPPWAWSMQGADDRLAAAIAVAAFMAGVGILARTPFRLRAE